MMIGDRGRFNTEDIDALRCEVLLMLFRECKCSFRKGVMKATVFNTTIDEQFRVGKIIHCKSTIRAITVSSLV